MTSKSRTGRPKTPTQETRRPKKTAPASQPRRGAAIGPAPSMAAKKIATPTNESGHNEKLGNARAKADPERTASAGRRYGASLSPTASLAKLISAILSVSHHLPSPFWTKSKSRHPASGLKSKLQAKNSCRTGLLNGENRTRPHRALTMPWRAKHQRENLPPIPHRRRPLSTLYSYSSSDKTGLAKPIDGLVADPPHPAT